MYRLGPEMFKGNPLYFQHITLLGQAVAEQDSRTNRPENGKPLSKPRKICRQKGWEQMEQRGVIIALQKQEFPDDAGCGQVISRSGGEQASMGRLAWSKNGR
jgi:alkylated DNA repair dioxygenase AlkB